MTPDTEKNDLSVLKIQHEDNDTYETHTKRKRRTLIVFIIIIAALIGATIAINPFSRPAQVQTTTVVSLSPTQAATILNASGYVVAQREAAVASKATGRLVFLGVEEGDQVKKDQILARIESEDVEAQLAQAKANYNYAVATLGQAKAELTDAGLQYGRMKKLLKDQLVPETEYDAAEARYKSAQASVEATEANIRAMSAGVQAMEVAVENTNIRAPFDGTVLNKYADEGEMVAPFAAGANARASVLTIADMESMQVEADVSESNIEKVKIGLPCQIILDAYPEKAYHGIVHKIVPTADRSKATVLTKIRFTDRDNFVLPEMSAKVAFLSESYATDNNNASKLAVYSTAIVKRNDKQIAFRIMEKENKVEEVTIETGSTIGDYMEIISGLKLGDKVVLNPGEELKNGSKVHIAQ